MKKHLILLFIFLIPFFGIAQEKESKNIEQFVNEIDNKIPQLLHDFLVPGAAIAIIEKGEIILQKGYGFADIEKEVKVTTKTGFNVGSISKNVAAWGVMKLVHEGKIELDAPAEKYLTRWHLPDSEFNSDGVTIRRLLSHTAGLSLHMRYPAKRLPTIHLPTIEEWLERQKQWTWASRNYYGTWDERAIFRRWVHRVLQLIIEEVTVDKNMRTTCRNKILDPLGMTEQQF